MRSATVDPVIADADYRSVQQVPLASYDAALVCTPDEAKLELLRHLLENGKHVLVEKPLLAAERRVARAAAPGGERIRRGLLYRL